MPFSNSSKSSTIFTTQYITYSTSYIRGLGTEISIVAVFSLQSISLYNIQDSLMTNALMQLPTCTIIYSILSHLYSHGHATSEMPKYMTMEQPQSWIVCTKSQYHIAFSRNNERVS